MSCYTLRGEVRMKKIRCIIIVMCLLFSFTACDVREKLPDMYIEKAQLTQEELNIVELLGIDDTYTIYDFQVNDTIKAIQINTYELENGKWSLIVGGGGRTFEDAGGRIALSAENIAEGCRIAIQGENNRGSNSYTNEINKDQENMGKATSYLTDIEEIIYEQEIPLVIQIQTSKNTISSYNVEYFYQPEEYSKYDYEHVYAITVRFSQKTVGELDAITKNKD